MSFRVTRTATFVFLAVALGLMLGVAVVYENRGFADSPKSRAGLKTGDFDGRRAYEYLQEICKLGPRQSGSSGMLAQQKLLREHFEKLGATVDLQAFRTRHPDDGSEVPMANLRAVWHPDRKNRVLLCAHYDTRPYPDRDRVNPRGEFIGANDGGSGVAVLMELAHRVGELKGNLGVDFVLFDGEEFVFDDTRDAYFLGSDFFARDYLAAKAPHRYVAGVLLDMVGDANLELHQERNSAYWADTKPIVNELWQTAARLQVKEFIFKKKHEVRDDHLPLHNIGRIACIDVIDLDYPHWHTMQDTPDKCSAESLGKVGYVVETWLKERASRDR